MKLNLKNSLWYKNDLAPNLTKAALKDSFLGRMDPKIWRPFGKEHSRGRYWRRVAFPEKMSNELKQVFTLRK